MDINDPALTATAIEQAAIDAYSGLAGHAPATIEQPGAGLQNRPSDAPSQTFDPQANDLQRPGLDALAASVSADNRVARVFSDKRRLDL